MIRVRLFAGAAEAAGTTAAEVEAGTAAELRRALVAAHGAALAEVLPRCALLADGVRLDDDATALTAGGTVDVLPPFAGG